MKLDVPPPFFDRWEQRFAQVSREELLIGVGLFVGSMVASAALSIFILCRLPVDHLRADPPILTGPHHAPIRRILKRIGKNLLGLLLVAAGVVMSLPGVPGQGLLTIVIGVMLLDFPGKLALERKLMMRPSIFKSINKLRVRFGKEPLLPVETEIATENPGE
jgi:hypothetical protein